MIRLTVDGGLYRIQQPITERQVSYVRDIAQQSPRVQEKLSVSAA